jgi:L-amino acid N-acyltransferase YncA
VALDQIDVTEIRDARPDDLRQVVAIHNALISTTTIEWRDEPHTLDDRHRWLAEHEAAGDPVLVAVDGEDVLGFAAFSDFRDTRRWPGYRFVVEHTVHVREDQWGTGVGRALVDALLDRARQAGKRVVVAAVDGSNTGSIRFHERVGFVQVARLPGVGFKHGRWLDLVLLQRDV